METSGRWRAQSSLPISPFHHDVAKSPRPGDGTSPPNQREARSQKRAAADDRDHQRTPGEIEGRAENKREKPLPHGSILSAPDPPPEGQSSFANRHCPNHH